jgi:DNA-binding NarL/FixJ family response regulator
MGRKKGTPQSEKQRLKVQTTRGTYERNRLILRLLAEGSTQTEIAVMLRMSRQQVNEIVKRDSTEN